MENKSVKSLSVYPGKQGKTIRMLTSMFPILLSDDWRLKLQYLNI